RNRVTEDSVFVCLLSPCHPVTFHLVRIQGRGTSIGTGFGSRPIGSLPVPPLCDPNRTAAKFLITRSISGSSRLLNSPTVTRLLLRVCSTNDLNCRSLLLRNFANSCA